MSLDFWFSIVASALSSAPLPLQQLQLWQLWLRLWSTRKAQKPQEPGFLPRVRWPVLSGEFIPTGMLTLNIHIRIIVWHVSPRLFTYQHGRDSKGSHGKSPPHKSSDFDKYSDYSDDKYDYDEEEDGYEDDMSEYPQSKDSASQGLGRGRHAKEHMKRGNMRPMKQQQCMNAFQIQTLLISAHSCSNLSIYYPW